MLLKIYFMKKIVFLSAILSLLISCNKTEGQGGTSSIKGKITVENYNGSGTLKATYPAEDEKVFIIYGSDNTTYSDKTTTSYDGTYRFDNLTPGTYKIYSYSKCSTCDSGQEAVVVTVEVSGKKQDADAPEIIIKQ